MSTFYQVGGATGLIGDPSGRTKERDKMAHETVEKNLCGISENLERITRNHELLVEGDTKPLPPLKSVGKKPFNVLGAKQRSLLGVHL